MDPLPMMLLLTILLCSLVAGLLFGFAVVVMPGIANLENREFLMAFKHMDEVIQTISLYSSWFGVVQFFQCSSH